MKDIKKIKLSVKIIALSLLCTSCIKTAEDIKREQMVSTLSLQMVQSQQVSANTTVQVQDLEQKLEEFRGIFEDIQQKNDDKNKKLIDDITANVNVIMEDNKVQKIALDKNGQEIINLKAQVEEQKIFIETVLKTLEDIKKSNKRKRAKKKIVKRSKYDQAMYDYSKGKYSKAKRALIQLEKSKRIKGNKKARIVHNIGMILYMEKKYPESQAYFSDLIIKYPKTNYAKRGLLFIGKSFVKLNQNENAIQTFNEVITRYPKSSFSKRANDELRKIKK